jgi:DNA-directed RNA polymerase specialized sigma24 family protein
MKIPKGMTEEQLIEIVDSIIKRLSSTYSFGYYQSQDIAQECWLLAIDGLERYDGERCLENFLFIHIKNRLLNLKRNKFSRNDIPCKKCPHYRPKEYFDDKCDFFEKRMDCKEFATWKQRNHLKRELCSSNYNVDTYDNLDAQADVEQETEINELRALIDKKLDINLRADYLKMRAGVTIPKAKKELIENEIRAIISRREESR